MLLFGFAGYGLRYQELVFAFGDAVHCQDPLNMVGLLQSETSACPQGQELRLAGQHDCAEAIADLVIRVAV